MAYKTINDGFYYDSDVRDLPKIASDLLLYLITNPHGHFSGIYYLPLPTVPIESKLEPAQINEAIAILASVEQNQIDSDRVSGIENLEKQQKHKPDRVSIFGIDKKHYFIRFDPIQNIVFVKSMLRHQTGGRMSDRQIRSVLTHITQFNKSSVIVPFLDYHREYISRCFFGFEKMNETGDERKRAAGRFRQERLKKDIEDFYQLHGLSFFCSEKYPIRQYRQEEEEEEAEEEASASNQISNGSSNLEGKEEEAPSKEDKERLSNLCLQLKNLDPEFNPYQFVQKTIKAEIPHVVTIDVLEQIVKYKGTIEKVWPYATDILGKKYQQYGYAQSLREHLGHKEPIRLGKLKVID